MRLALDSSRSLSDWAVDILDSLKAHDLLILEVSEITTLTDYMVIATGTSSRHVSSLVDHLLMGAKKLEIEVLGVEGRSNADWVLVDFGDALVHVMQRETRKFYDLERLWSTSTATQARA